MKYVSGILHMNTKYSALYVDSFEENDFEHGGVLFSCKDDGFYEFGLEVSDTCSGEVTRVGMEDALVGAANGVKLLGLDAEFTSWSVPDVEAMYYNLIGVYVEAMTKERALAVAADVSRLKLAGYPILWNGFIERGDTSMVHGVVLEVPAPARGVSVHFLDGEDMQDAVEGVEVVSFPTGFSLYSGWDVVLMDGISVYARVKEVRINGDYILCPEVFQRLKDSGVDRLAVNGEVEFTGFDELFSTVKAYTSSFEYLNSVTNMLEIECANGFYEVDFKELAIKKVR